MIDRVEIEVRGGNGGNGAISGRREKFVPEGGPDGGDGGTGGSIYAICDEGVNTLLAFRYKKTFSAGDGSAGQGVLRHGRNGDDIEIVLPVGTEVREVGRGNALVADMSVHGERVVLAGGGNGGRGNTRFASSTSQFPLIAEEGNPGRRSTLSLELKLLADVGIVGAPNAGKSSLLAAVTAARPKVAEYEFTSLEPTLGVVDHHGSRFVMVDIPGLIEGAHDGAGLGHDFLKHIGRTRVLVHVVDGTSEDIAADYDRVRNELELHSQDLASKPEVLAVNKVDVPGVRDRCAEADRDLSPRTGAVHCISAVGLQGLDELLDTVVRLLEEAPVPQSSVETDQLDGTVPVLRPKAVGKREIVRSRGGKQVVVLRAATRLAAMVDRTDLQARAQLYDQLRKLGVTAALENAGIQAGETFMMGKREWEWEG